jgi:hypothetical protein
VRFRRAGLITFASMALCIASPASVRCDVNVDLSLAPFAIRTSRFGQPATESTATIDRGTTASAFMHLADRRSGQTAVSGRPRCDRATSSRLGRLPQPPYARSPFRFRRAGPSFRGIACRTIGRSAPRRAVAATPGNRGQPNRGAASESSVVCKAVVSKGSRHHRLAPCMILYPGRCEAWEQLTQRT